MTFVNQHMINDFQILDSELFFPQAIEVLGNKRYGLVKNADLQIIGIISTTEMSNITYSPQIKISQVLTGTPILYIRQEVEMRTLIESPFIRIIGENTPALVIDASSQSLGLLTKKAIKEFIANSFGLIRGPVFGSEQLGGSEFPLSVQISCRNCYYPNRFSSSQWEEIQVHQGTPPFCQNPQDRHLFQRDPS